MKIGIVIVDMINDFVTGVLKFERAGTVGETFGLAPSRQPLICSEV